MGTRGWRQSPSCPGVRGRWFCVGGPCSGSSSNSAAVGRFNTPLLQKTGFLSKGWCPCSHSADRVQGQRETCKKENKNDAANVNCSALLGHQAWTSQTAEGQEVSGKQKVCECFLSSLTEGKKKTERFLLEKHIWLHNILNFKSCNFFLFV